MRARLIALSIAVLLLVPAAAHAAWPRPSHVNVPVSVAAGDQLYPSIVSDDAGGAIIAWADTRGGLQDIYVQRMSSTGAPLWTVNGVVVCNAAGDQTSVQTVPDGAGGMILTWQDSRSGNADVYAQRVNASGVAQWTANGVPVCTAIGNQTSPMLVADGGGGAFIAWQDLRSGTTNDVYVQHLTSGGAPLWTANGSAISTGAGEQAAQRLAVDGTGGAILTWHDARSGVYDIYAQRINSLGLVQWTANGIPLCTAAANQGDPTIVSDAAGGALVAWWDQRNGVNATDLYIQHVSASGGLLLNTNGNILCNAFQTQNSPRMVSDGTGGAFVVWQDYRNDFWVEVFAQRLNSNGGGMWAGNGVELFAGSYEDHYNPVITPDGTGGAIAAWYDLRDPTQSDIYVQRVNANGVVQWGSRALGLCTAATSQLSPVIAPDGAGGAIVAWWDGRNGGGLYDIYAQRVEHYGYLGNPEPAIASVRDVANDQGGKVRVSWAASFLDVEPTYGIAEYRLWRAVSPAATFASGVTLGRTVTADADEAAATGAVWAAGNGYAWEYAGTQVAAAFAQYSLVTTTTGDSVAASNPRTAFMVEARAGTALNANRWLSAPDSGYSVDNLAPSAPAAVTGSHVAGTTTLHWAPNAEADFASYRLYRGTTAGFVPGPSNLVASQPDTGYADPAPAAFYKLSAVDTHGNESGYALLFPGTVDAPPNDVPLAFRLARPMPNPSMAHTRIEFELPDASAASLVVYAPSGRAVRTLFKGTREAGRVALTWDLKDDDGRDVPPGVYFVRFEAGGRRFTERMIAMR